MDIVYLQRLSVLLAALPFATGDEPLHVMKAASRVLSVHTPDVLSVYKGMETSQKDSGA